MTDKETRELMQNFNALNDTFKKGQTVLNDIIGYYNMFEKAMLWLNEQMYGESSIEDREAKIKSLNDQKDKLKNDYKKKLMTEQGVHLNEDQANAIMANGGEIPKDMVGGLSNLTYPDSAGGSVYQETQNVLSSYHEALAEIDEKLALFQTDLNVLKQRKAKNEAARQKAEAEEAAYRQDLKDVVTQGKALLEQVKTAAQAIDAVNNKLSSFEEQLPLLDHFSRDTNEMIYTLCNMLQGTYGAVLLGGAPAPKPTNTPASQSAPLLDTQAFAPTIGQAHDGIDSVPREGTWLLDKGERVLDARTNRDLKSFLANDDDEELVELMAQNNSLLEATHALLEERLTGSFDASGSVQDIEAISSGVPMPDFEEVDAQGATQELRDFKAATTEAGQAATDFDDTMNGMQVQMLDLEDICQKTLGNVTQQMRDFGAAATDAGQAVSGLEPAMNGIQEQMQGLEEIFQKTLNGRAIFEAVYEGDDIDSLMKGLQAQLNAYAAQKSSHLLMEAAYQTVLGTASLLNPFSTGNSAGHFAAAAEYASGATLMAAFAKLSGMAHDGMDYIPQEGSWLLDKGERVVDARTNKDLKDFLVNGTGNVNVNVNIYGGDAEGIQKVLPELERVVTRAVAGNIIMGGEIKHAIMNYTR